MLTHLVQGVHTVALGGGWGRQVVDHHLQQCLVGGQPRLHDTLHQGLADQLLVVTVEWRMLRLVSFSECISLSRWSWGEAQLLCDAKHVLLLAHLLMTQGLIPICSM